jgi:hypothetical protein
MEMRKFIKKCLLALVIEGAVVYLFSLAVLAIEYYLDFDIIHFNGFEVIHSINKSKKKAAAKKLIIGDSTGNQLYSNYSYNDSVYSIACNRAITMAGQYFLLNNFFKANSGNLPKEVILVYHPLSFRDNLDRFAFHYLLKPFYNSDYPIDSVLNHYIVTVPFYRITKLRFVQASNYMPSYDLPQEKNVWFSTITKDYLAKIRQLCQSKGVAFRMVSSPVRSDIRAEVERTMSYYPDSSAYITDYKRTIRYFDKSLFKDKVHMIKADVPTDYYHFVN